MIRDRIVVGLLDEALAEKLQLDSKLTLETAVTTARQSEGVHKQQSVVRGKSTVNNTELVDAVDAVHSSQGVKKKFQHNKWREISCLAEHLQLNKTKLKDVLDVASHPVIVDTNAQQEMLFVIVVRKKGHFQTMCRTQSNKYTVLLQLSHFWEWSQIPLTVQHGMLPCL